MKIILGSAVFLLAMALGAWTVYRVNTPWTVRAACEAIYSPLQCVEAYYSVATRPSVQRAR
jgi:hypothetical protein